MTLSRRIQAIVKLDAVSGIGPAKVRRIFDQLLCSETDLEFLVEFDLPDLLALGLNDTQAAAFLEADSVEIAERIAESGVQLVTSLDSATNGFLQNSSIAPWFFYFGDLDILSDSAIGFSGSRDASPKAIGVTAEIAGQSTERGWSVISGGARGVDMAAHVAALEHGGGTVVLLPQGIATWRMPDELREGNVLVLSEFQPYDDWGSYRAMQRNKSIVHLSDWLVIPQAGIRGGTRNAGEYALKQKHPTWIVDLGPEYEGNAALIALGAKPLAWRNEPDDLDVLLASSLPEIPSQSSLF